MNPLSPEIIGEFVKLVGERLEGEWVLLGGTLMWAMGIGNRPTTDIDLVGVSQKEAANSLGLMALADTLGLPLETVNQAAVVYLWKVKDFRKHLVVLHQGSNACIYRPDTYLFVRLKLSRFNESDLEDCQLFLEQGLDRGQVSWNLSDLTNLVKKELVITEEHTPKAQRLREFKDFISSHGV